MQRRDFLKIAGAAGVAALGAHSFGRQNRSPFREPRPTGKSAAGLVAPKLDRVRVGMIGVGARGGGHLGDLLALDGVDVLAIADNHEPTANAALKQFEKRNLPKPTLYTRGDYDYRRMLERDDLDMIVIATPWDWHAKMAVDTMKAGKHAMLEVPAALTVEDCWLLVDTAEQTQKHCMMLENVCYGREELLVLNMVRRGVFGELLHGEAAYIHDLRTQMHEENHGTGSWRTHFYATMNGNLYPTHGLGPVAQYMNINRGDRMEYMSSMSSNARVRDIYAAAKFPEGHKWRKLKFKCGDINTSIVKTVQGKTIMIQWDEQLPRPYTRHNLIQGTKGVWGGFPNRTVIEGRSPNTHDWQEGDELKSWYDQYESGLWKEVGEVARKQGGHGGMDFIMWWRVIYCLRNGLPMDQDVYDAASWSVITPLSGWSVANRGQSVDIPDFTRGKWKTMKPLDFN